MFLGERIKYIFFCFIEFYKHQILYSQARYKVTKRIYFVMNVYGKTIKIYFRITKRWEQALDFCKTKLLTFRYRNHLTMIFKANVSYTIYRNVARKGYHSGFISNFHLAKCSLSAKFSLRTLNYLCYWILYLAVGSDYWANYSEYSHWVVQLMVDVTYNIKKVYYTTPLSLWCVQQTFDRGMRREHDEDFIWTSLIWYVFVYSMCVGMFLNP